MFAGVGVLALIATLGLLAGLARDVGSRLPVTGLRERLGVIRQPAVLRTLLVTTLWATGAYTVYTYIASLLYATAGIEGPYLSAVLFVWGLSAATGIFAGGTLTDKHGARPVIVLGLLFLALAFASLSVSATLLSKAAAVGPALVAIVIWGLSAWAFFPAQQTRLIGIAGIRVAPIVLSLNASFMFLGFSLGAALGSVTLTYAAPSALGWVGEPLRSRIAFALDPNVAHDRSSVGAGSSAINGFVEPRRQHRPCCHLSSFPHGEQHDQHITRTEQGARARSLRHTVQQTRLCCHQALRVGTLHPAQRPPNGRPAMARFRPEQTSPLDPVRANSDQAASCPQMTILDVRAGQAPSGIPSIQCVRISL